MVFNLSTLEMVARVAECGITNGGEVVPAQPVLFAFFFIGHSTNMFADFHLHAFMLMSQNSETAYSNSRKESSTTWDINWEWVFSSLLPFWELWLTKTTFENVWGKFCKWPKKENIRLSNIPKKKETRIVHDFHKIKNKNKIVDDIIEFMN